MSDGIQCVKFQKSRKKARIFLRTTNVTDAYFTSIFFLFGLLNSSFELTKNTV